MQVNVGESKMKTFQGSRGLNDTLTACSAAVSLAKRRQPLRDIRGHQLRYS